MDITDYNREAWNHEVRRGCRWTVPVDPAAVAAARQGQPPLVLTPKHAIPSEWFPEWKGCRVLALASGGGQQGPLLAATGAEVTVLDLADEQLAQDRRVAEREGLRLRTEQGDMRDLSRFADGAFDLVVHPSSNTFVPDVHPVWRECHRVLRPGGELWAGFCNPVMWIFDDVAAEERGELVVRHRIPYSDTESIGAAERQRYLDQNSPLCFGHRLEDLIGGQLAAGFQLVGFFEDHLGDHPLDRYIESMIATRAVRPG